MASNNKNNLRVGIDIGTSKVVCIIAENTLEGINLKNVNKIKPSKEEKSINPRSRSAILRIGEIEYVS